MVCPTMMVGLLFHKWSDVELIIGKFYPGDNSDSVIPGPSTRGSGGSSEHTGSQDDEDEGEGDADLDECPAFSGTAVRERCPKPLPSFMQDDEDEDGDGDECSFLTATAARQWGSKPLPSFMQDDSDEDNDEYPAPTARNRSVGQATEIPSPVSIFPIGLPVQED